MGNHSPSDIKTPIVVTGATGFIGENIIKILLEKGYNVKATVQYLALKQKYQYLRLFPGAERLIITEGQLTDPDVWDKVFNGIDYVIHVASPDPPYLVQQQQKQTKPAVEGAQNIMNAAIRQKVKRVIFTSSAATLYQHTSSQTALDQSYWGITEGNFPEPKSKILSQKKIWQIYNTQDLTKQHTQLVTLLPSLIVGPLYSSHTIVSQSVLASIFNGYFKGIPTPQIILNMVDVRDVAQAHCLALIKDNVDNQRITISASPVSYTQLFNWLSSQFPKAPIPTEPASIQKIASEGTHSLHLALAAAAKYQKLSNSKSQLLLGIKYHKPKDSVITMARDMVKLGIVKY